VTSASGWLGAHLSYALGVGIDTTSFQHYPQAWTDDAAASEIPEGRMVVATRRACRCCCPASTDPSSHWQIATRIEAGRCTRAR
jgi:hypothetical protein